MFKGGRKGRISNELVAASCAAVLTVYAAGYWRTRHDARRLGSEAQARPVRPAPAAPVAQAPVPAPVPIAQAAPSVALAASQGQLPPTEASTVTASSTPVPMPVSVPVPSPAPSVTAPAKPVVVSPSPAVAQTSEPDAEAAVAGDTPASQPPVVPTSTWHDGYYTGWGQSPHGDIEAWVTIKDGRIVDAGILTCATRYPCAVIDSVLHQPVALQSAEVDRVSRATESADAYYWGLVAALKKSETWPAVPATSQ